MRQEMSFVSLILFVAIGILVFAILFLFAKRQIARFSLKSTRTPHASIGADAPKPLRHEIERRLKRSQEIRVEPITMSSRYEEAFRNGPTKDNFYLYRMKAIDAFKQFDAVIRSLDGPRKRPDQSMRHYLLILLQGPLKATTELVHEFADAYEHARHDPALFRETELNQYLSLLDELIAATRSKIVSRHNSTVSSSSATSQTALLGTDEQTTPTVLCRGGAQTREDSMTIVPEESAA